MTAGSLALSDEARDRLLAGAQAGDAAAFEALARAHGDRLFAMILHLTGDRSDAEDILQETLLRAWRAIGRFERRADLATWLHRIAVNETNRMLGQRTRRADDVSVDHRAEAFPASRRDEPGPRAEHRELHDALQHAIRELPLAYRTALVLRDVEGLSTRDAATVAGVGERAFKSRLHEARLRVRAALDAVAPAEARRVPECAQPPG